MRKVTEYEYWPLWVFYAPFVPYWFLNSLKSRSFSYFCKVNPGIEFGGFLDYSKSKILHQIPEEFKPKTRFFYNRSEIKNLPEFPFVVKPDLGERGVNVELIRSFDDWMDYPLEKKLILQDFVDLPLEFGVFFAKFPDKNSGEILSITGKEFLIYKADGKSTLGEFVAKNPRAFSRIDYLKNKFKMDWDKIHPKETEILLEPIGNHNRGTRFLDASDLISEELTQVITHIANHIEGFHYGRFDVKATSVEEFQQGKFKILEVNGANSEPTHIYDEKFSLIQAYKEVKRHLDIQYKISKKHSKTYSSKAFYKAVMNRLV